MDQRRLRLKLAVAAAGVVLAGCAGRPDAGAFVGGTTGAVIGSQLPGAGAAGIIVGGVAGAAIGADGSRRAGERQQGQ